MWLGYTGISQVAGFHLALLLVVVGAMKPASRFRELSVLFLERWTVSVQRFPEVGVGVTGRGAGRRRRGLPSRFWVVEGCTCRVFSWVR